MPELPDVETFKRYLDATSLYQRIADVEMRSAYVLKGISGKELARRLKGRRFESTRRHGKHLFARTDGGTWLRLHFGMTGSLRYFKGEEKVPPHTRVLFVFAKDYRLAFDDQRKFGQVGLLEDVDEFLRKRALGPDALDIDVDEPAIDCRHRQHLRRRNSFPCPHSSGHADRASLRQRPKAPLPCNAARIGKSGPLPS